MAPAKPAPKPEVSQGLGVCWHWEAAKRLSASEISDISKTRRPLQLLKLAPKTRRNTLARSSLGSKHPGLPGNGTVRPLHLTLASCTPQRAPFTSMLGVISGSLFVDCCAADGAASSRLFAHLGLPLACGPCERHRKRHTSKGFPHLGDCSAANGHR